MTSLRERLLAKLKFDGNRLAANIKYVETFQFAAHDKIEFIGQTATLLHIAKERCHQIDRTKALILALVECVPVLEENQYTDECGYPRDEVINALAAVEAALEEE